jgi:alkylation response protein AidB-like acyl-CoA dehydrogenase
MDFRLADDQRMLGETLGRFLKDNYPIERRHEIAQSPDRHSRELWKQFCELGIVGALFSPDDGGYGGTGIDLAVVFEALGRHLVVEPFLPTLMAGSLLARSGAREQKELIAKAIAGEEWLAFAHGEPAARYELAHVETAAKKSGSGWELTGKKSVVLGAPAATQLVVSARTSGKADAEKGISLFLVDPKGKGVKLRDYGTVDGYAAGEVSLDGVAGELLGKEGGAYAAIEAAIARANVALCAEALGAMERAKDITVEYMHTRKQFGVPIGKFQVLQHRMADILIELEQMRSAVINAAAHLDAERDIRERHVSAAKHLAGRIGRQVAEEAIQIHGGMGMTWEYPVGHFAKRIVMIDHWFGDTDHHLERFIALS